MRHCNLVGQNVAKFRIQLELSQEDLARELQLDGLSISRDSVAKIEARKQSVSDTQLQHFARVLRVTVIDLYPEMPVNHSTVNRGAANSIANQPAVNHTRR